MVTSYIQLELFVFCTSHFCVLVLLVYLSNQNFKLG
jgi:hypothetical protein